MVMLQHVLLMLEMIYKLFLLPIIILCTVIVVIVSARFLCNYAYLYRQSVPILLFYLVVSVVIFMLLQKRRKKLRRLISGCILLVLCPLPLLSACNTTCNNPAFCSASPTLSVGPKLSVGAIAGLAVAGIVVAVITVILSDHYLESP